MRFSIASPNLFGQIDAIRDGELHGWALAVDKPREPLKITVQINGRPVAEALACYYRPDIAEQMNCPGQNGFYVDLSYFRNREAEVIVDVRFPNGEYLDGSPVRARIPFRRRPKVPTLLFMHMAKTAGTAFREAITENYKQSEIAYIYPHPPGFPIRDAQDLPLEQRARFRLIAGHFQYGLHDSIPNDCCYFTIVRDPIGRVWSHYSYLLQNKDPLAFSGSRIRTLEELLESRASSDLDNLMVRCFAGVDENAFPCGSIDREIYDMARRNLDAFPYIGDQNRLDDAYVWLQRKFGWMHAFPVAEMNRGLYSGVLPRSESDENLIRHFNSWDLKLYEDIRREVAS